MTRPTTMTNRRGERLAGVLHGTLADVAVVSCHGMFSSKGGDKHLMLAERLDKLGVPCLRFDFAGLGDSEGKLEDMTYSREVHDLDAAIEWLAAQGVQRIALFGSSMGGAVALLTAARDERVVGVATLAAVAHPHDIESRRPDAVAAWLSQGFFEENGLRLNRTYYDDALSHDVESAVRILRIPLFVVHGAEDTVVPVSDAYDIAAAARQAQLDVVDGADHRFSDPVHLRPALDKIVAFLAGVLRPST